MRWPVNCNAIIRCHLQPIYTSINTFFNKFRIFNKEEGIPIKLNGAVDKSSAEQQIHKSGMIVHVPSKIWSPASSKTESYSRQAGRQCHKCSLNFAILHFYSTQAVKFTQIKFKIAQIHRIYSWIMKKTVRE